MVLSHEIFRQSRRVVLSIELADTGRIQIHAPEPVTELTESEAELFLEALESVRREQAAYLAEIASGEAEA